MSSNDTATETTTAKLLEAPSVQELVRQIRAQDSYGVYKNWSDDLVLKPFIIDRRERRKISVEGEVNPATINRIELFYRAIASRIEQETGPVVQVVIELNHEGFGWALVFCGRLLLVVRSLRDAHRFGFDSLEKLAIEAEKLTQAGIELAKRYPEVYRL
ncbi:MAG: NifX-associated nitrogen fixation protein [Symploca sp. SIO3C6]|uniref:NifX-associated nitrogen fixation protein n=1 Tax=Symploca sp. SIO1C4 TaxID=2607765 RepID=A0A6B3N7Z2_9CYAN|nr:NifX-associated nitrogen fixation protein [Symploca sp. SIO3C6]NER27747.1 NifX-associated nitrogen fixation protein [Symploca sp. SIO1C4]NET05826.1 NifX-associated nitrogen fixation protein [Symploca sp. SIO2B6]NET49970.1 NifX-associated nitrogen fixation protein [Merismopedia sp. SIO2A8]